METKNPGRPNRFYWAEKIAFLITLAAATGCGAQIRPDHFPPSISSGYHSSELYACGRHFLGVGQCELRIGDDVSSLGIQFHGYNKGSGRIFSEALPGDVNIRYSRTGPVDVLLRGRPTESVVLKFAVNPEFPGEEDLTFPIFGTSGFLVINVVHPGEKWEYLNTRAPEGLDQIAFFETPGATRIRAISEECGIDTIVPASSGLTRLSLRDLLDPQGVGTCLIQLATDAPKPSYGSWVSIRYARGYRPLPAPETRREGNKVIVEADDTATVVALDNQYHINYVGDFAFDPDQPHRVRALTVRGRIAIGDYDPVRGWSWRN